MLTRLILGSIFVALLGLSRLGSASDTCIDAYARLVELQTGLSKASSAKLTNAVRFPSDFRSVADRAASGEKISNELLAQLGIPKELHRFYDSKTGRFQYS